MLLLGQSPRSKLSTPNLCSRRQFNNIVLNPGTAEKELPLRQLKIKCLWSTLEATHVDNLPCRPVNQLSNINPRTIFRIPSAPIRKKLPSSNSIIKKIYHTRTQSIQLDLLLCSSRTAWSTIVLEMAMELRVFWKQWVVSANDTVRQKLIVPCQ